MVLVESGPWSGSIDSHLSRLQERLYGCVDAALGGQLAEKFPESLGKQIVIDLECFNLPRDEVRAFFERFADGVFSLGDYKDAPARSKYVRGISFAVNFDSIH